MGNLITCLYLVVLSLFDLLDFGTAIKTDSVALTNPTTEEQIQCESRRLRNVAEEPQNPFGNVMRTSHPSHRLASSRPLRLLPTYGGKPTQHHGRWAQANSTNHQNLSRQQHHALFRHGLPTSSPRRYYVIALRRLLC